MRADRRSFLKLAGAALLPGVPAIWWEARGLVRGGALGRVVFCRVPPSMADRLRFLLEGAIPVCEQIDSKELVLCGTEATLVVGATGCRRFA